MACSIVASGADIGLTACTYAPKFQGYLSLPIYILIMCCVWILVSGVWSVVNVRVVITGTKTKALRILIPFGGGRY